MTRRQIQFRIFTQWVMPLPFAGLVALLAGVALAQLMEPFYLRTLLLALAIGAYVFGFWALRQALPKLEKAAGFSVER